MKFLAVIAGLGVVLAVVLLLRAPDVTGQLLFGALAISMLVLAIGSLVAARKAKSSKSADHH